MAPHRGGYRPDIEGLRAVAVLAVLCFHAGIPLVGGGFVGVDVFFVISGFLITGLLVKELDRTGRISLTAFYARRVRRLLPAAVVVLVAVAIASAFLLAPVQRAEVGGQIATAGLYVINWALAAQAVDYFAADVVNPVQHFWSLAVEEQFYLIWPAMLAAVAILWWRRGRERHRRALFGVVSVIAVASFAYSMYATYRGAEDAYFSTISRGWELALGAIVALGISRLPRLPAAFVRALGVAGLVAIVWSATTIGESTAFPGLAALVPTLGTVALIIAGAYNAGWTQRLLTLAPVRHIGKISYSWYLWHWPVLVFVTIQLGELTPMVGFLVAGLSYVPAVLSYHFVEQPFRTWRRLETSARWGWRLAFGCTACALGAGLVLWLSVPTSQVSPPATVAGAEAVRDNPELQRTANRVSPDPMEAKDDLAQIDTDGCQVAPADTEVLNCVYGDPDAETTVVAFGDSHMMQYGPALDALAEENGWRVPVFIKSGCPPSDTTMFNASLKREYAECDEWRADALDRIEDEEADLILLAGRATTPVMEDGEELTTEEGNRRLEDGWVRTFERLRETSAELVVFRDNPQLSEDVPACVSRSLDRLKDCAVPVSEALDFEPVEIDAAERVPGVHTVDLTPVFCPGDMCPAVIGDAIVYRDTEHLTATFAETLPALIEEQLPVPSGPGS